MIKNPHPLVEVLLVCFNSEGTIFRTLSSIDTQTYPSLSVTIIDDGSSDNTVSIISEWMNLSHIKEKRLLSYDINKGLSLRLSEFIPLKDTQYLARIDSDDFWKPDKISKQVSLMIASSHLAVCGTSVELFFIDPIQHAQKVRKHTHRLDFFSNYLIYYKNIFAHSSLLFRIEPFLAVNGYRNALKYSQDYDILLRLRENGYVFSSIRECLVYLGQSQKQISAKKQTEQLECVYISQKSLGLPVIHTKISKVLNSNQSKFTKIKQVLLSGSKLSYILYHFFTYFRLWLCNNGYRWIHPDW